MYRTPEQSNRQKIKPGLGTPTSRIAGVAANDASAIATIVSPVAILPPAPAHTIIHTAQRLRQDAAWYRVPRVGGAEH